MASLKKLAAKEDLLTGGHRACAGCAAPIIVRQILLAAENPVVVGCATGCLEVTTTLFPYTAWKVPFIHNAFENSEETAGLMISVFSRFRAPWNAGTECFMFVTTTMPI